MKPREYCCCAIPLVNAGVFSVLVEQLVASVIAGTLAIATPSIVGAATPSFAKWIFAIVCYVAAAIQVFGFMGVAQEKTILYRRYLTLHILATVAVFAVAAAWAIISASRHSTAAAACLSAFFPNAALNSTDKTEGNTLCDIFPWVDVGIMGGLWAFFAAVHIYFYVVLSSYGKGQRQDHDDYAAIDTKPLNDNIPMTNAQPWESRPSNDVLLDQNKYNHQRDMSGQSFQDVAAEPIQREYDAYSQSSYPPRQNSTRRPGNAYTQDPGPTPQWSNNYYSGGNGGNLNKPLPSYAHPAGGSFRRKTSRLRKVEPEANFDQNFFRARR